jgi:uncharacterized protein (DUF885 family)
MRFHLLTPCRSIPVLLACALSLTFSAVAQDAKDRVQNLSEQFWQWRVTEQPFTNDDIPRIDRPSGYTAKWSAKDVAEYETRIAEFEEKWRSLDVKAAPVPVQVDFRLLGSAIARVRWELDVIPDWKRNPFFYVDQGLTAAYTLMLPAAPFSSERQHDVVLRLESLPRLLDEGRANLVDMRQPYAVVAMEQLTGIEARMKRFRDGVHAKAAFASDELKRFDLAVEAATKALVAYREWLRPQVAGLRKETAVGREGYLYFLRNVALLPYTPEQILAIGEQEWQRAVAFEALQRAANIGLPETPVYKSIEDQIADEEKQEKFIRAYMVSHGIMSEPPSLKHYHYVEMPPYIAALSFLGVSDDLTSPNRLDQESVSYKGKPKSDMGFFGSITARDTRPLSIHEGVPGHFYQMAWSWHHADPVRRHYYDSESNEGIGFYAEEMMMIGGLFDGQPKTKEAIYSMMRLRALRVVVDVKLALGEFTLEQAANYLQKTVPMDAGTARSEAAMFASTPGQAITYQIGKTDILHLMSDARERQGTAFNLQKFHDFVWENGNLPFSLQRWEMLGDASAVPPVASTFSWNEK